MSQYFPEPKGRLGEKVNVELDLSNYIMKANLRWEKEIETSILVSKKIRVTWKLK